MTAWGLSPYRTTNIYLGEYDADHYLTLAYQAFVNLNWRIGYFDRDGIIAYTNLSWASYAEEISVKVFPGRILIKSECVGFQALFNDYGQNQRNLDRFFEEIEYAEFHLKDKLEQTTQDLIDTIPEKASVDLAEPPMAGKENLRDFLSVFTPRKNYWVTPLLALVNIGVFILTIVAIAVMAAVLAQSGKYEFDGNLYRKLLLAVGFSDRESVLHGEVWRLVTNTFQHFYILHVAGNMIVLIYIGSVIESKLGRWNFLILYLLTGICASMVSAMWHTNEVAGGASGAIFGLFGILLALLSTKYYEPSARRALLISTVIFVIYSIIPKSTRIDNAAHVGGLISGYILGLIAYWGIMPGRPKAKKWGIAAISTLLTIAFVAGGYILSPRYQTKRLDELKDAAADVFQDVRREFYRMDTVGREHKIMEFEKITIPRIKRLYTIADSVDHLILPSEQKELTTLQARVIRLQADEYGLLYKEYKESEKEKYRVRISLITDEISRMENKANELEARMRPGQSTENDE